MRRIVLVLMMMVIPVVRWAGAEGSTETAIPGNGQPQLSAEDLEINKNLEILENWDVLKEGEALNAESPEEQETTGEDNDQ